MNRVLLAQLNRARRCSELEDCVRRRSLWGADQLDLLPERHLGDALVPPLNHLACASPYFRPHHDPTRHTDQDPAYGSADEGQCKGRERAIKEGVPSARPALRSATVPCAASGAPMPILNSNGWPRLRELSKGLPSGKVPS